MRDDVGGSLVSAAQTAVDAACAAWEAASRAAEKAVLWLALAEAAKAVVMAEADEEADDAGPTHADLRGEVHHGG